jgi:hypothetical protein
MKNAAPAAQTIDLAEFAQAVNENAANPTACRYGDRKVWISELRYRLPARYAHLTADEYKALLVEASHRRLITLVRADYVTAMDPRLVAASHIREDMGLGAWCDFHFVLDETARRW